MEFGMLDAKWNPLMLTKISPPSKKSQRCHLKQKSSKIGYFKPLGDLGVNAIVDTIMMTLVMNKFTTIDIPIKHSCNESIHKLW